jgi:hypothetical protein
MSEAVFPKITHLIMENPYQLMDEPEQFVGECHFPRETFDKKLA